MSDSSYFLSECQYGWLAGELPEPRPRTGRPAIPNRELLPGIVFVLRTGCRWADIPESACPHHYSSCWRRLNFWRKRRAITRVWQEVLGKLDGEGKVDLTAGSLDGSLVQSPRFRSGTGYSGKHHRTGTNVVLTTERRGLPLSSVSGKGNRNDVVLAMRAVGKIRVKARRRVKALNADKGLDSAAFRKALRKKGIRANIPERQYRRRRKRGRKPLYDKALARFRAFVERTIAWLKSFRKLRYRYERKKSMFQAWLDFACLLICLRRVGVLQ